MSNSDTDRTITITNTDTTGSIQVSKVFVGLANDNLPTNFKITAVWGDGDDEKVDLTLNDDPERTKTGLTITMISPEVSSTPAETDATAETTVLTYVWTISGLPVDTEVVFTESGYSVDGYT